MTLKYQLRAKRRRSAHHNAKVLGLIKHMAQVLRSIDRAMGGATP